MSAINFGDVAFSGLRLLTRRPLSALVWSLVFVTFLTLMFVSIGGAILNFLSTTGVAGATGSAASLSPVTLLRTLGAFLGYYFLFLLGAMVISAVVQGAIYRSVLTPDDIGFASMRLGGQELWLMLLAFVMTILMGILQLVLGIPQVIIIAVLSLQSPQLAIPVRMVMQLFVYAIVIWVSLRLSLAAPMTFAERKLRIFESWELTKGHTLSLLGVGFLISLIGGVLYLVLAIVGFAAGLSIWRSTPHPENFAIFMQDPRHWLANFEGLVLFIGALILIGGTVITPVAIAPWMEFYRRLRPENDVASVFN